MEGIIKVDPDKLISTADSFGATGAQIQTITNTMTQTIEELKSTWEGEAATAYNTKFRSLDDDMQRMYRMIEEHVKDLTEMANQYKQAENANIETGSSLAGDVIS